MEIENYLLLRKEYDDEYDDEEKKLSKIASKLDKAEKSVTEKLSKIIKPLNADPAYDPDFDFQDDKVIVAVWDGHNNDIYDISYDKLKNVSKDNFSSFMRK